MALAPELFVPAEPNGSNKSRFKHIIFIPDFFVQGRNVNLDSVLRDIDFEFTRNGYFTEDYNSLPPMRFSNSTGTVDYSYLPGVSMADAEAICVTNDFISRQLGLPAYMNGSDSSAAIKEVQLNLHKDLSNDDITNVLMSKVNKPYDIYSFESSIAVVIHSGFFNMLLSAHKEFKVLLLSDLVNEFGKNYGLDELHKSILFNVFSLYI